MTTNWYDVRTNGPSTVAEPLGKGRVAALTRAASRGTTGSWTPAHSEVARFMGKSLAFGALLGAVVEMVRPVRAQRQG